MKSEDAVSSPTVDEIARAMERDELVLYYQPKVCLLRGIVVGAEALVRWSDPHSRVLSPSVFLPQVEASGLLHDLTVRLLDDIVSACAEVRQHIPDMALSINVAPNDLAKLSISSRILSYLNGGSISPSELQIEITESTAMGNFDVVRDEITALTTMGLKVLMDDFGTGHSSIDRLSQLPFSSLKLDQGVVRRMSTSSQNLNVVRSAISMARELGMTSIAEGVENAGQYNILIANGCEEAQGYYISKPLPLGEFIEFVRSGRSFRGSQIGFVNQAMYNVLRYRSSLMDIAVCSALDPAAVAPSIVNRRLADNHDGVGVNEWYYGVGQALSHLDAFLVLEEPLETLQKLGNELKRDLETLGGGVKLNQRLNDIDRCANGIVAQMHTLERALLAELAA